MDFHSEADSSLNVQEMHILEYILEQFSSFHNCEPHLFSQIRFNIIFQSTTSYLEWNVLSMGSD
jgi:hypothetical protein